jgi:hypothetical protein
MGQLPAYSAPEEIFCLLLCREKERPQEGDALLYIFLPKIRLRENTLSKARRVPAQLYLLKVFGAYVKHLTT